MSLISYILVNSRIGIYKKEKISKCLYKYITYVWFYENGNINKLFYYDLRKCISLSNEPNNITTWSN